MESSAAVIKLIMANVIFKYKNTYDLSLLKKKEIEKLRRICENIIQKNN
jgi:hypothetical protein